MTIAPRADLQTSQPVNIPPSCTDEPQTPATPITYANELSAKALALLNKLDQCVNSRDFKVMLAIAEIDGHPFKGPWIMEEAKALAIAIKAWNDAQASSLKTP